MPNVFLIQQPPPTGRGWTPNLAPASCHGQLRVLLGSNEKPVFNPDRCLSLLRQKLRDFDPREDKLLWAGGDALSLLLVGAVLGELGHRTLTYLRYDRRRDDVGSVVGGDYLPVTVNL